MDPVQATERDWSDLLVPLAERAGVEILDIYESADFDVERKEDRTPLTDADLASQRVLKAGLEEATPDIPVLSEEAAEIDYATRREWEVMWLVDPLDGTKEFIKRNGEFTVNVALVVSGEPRAGVVHAPAIDRTYFGQGDRAWWIADGDREPLETAPMDGGKLRVVASRSHLNDATRDFIDDLDGEVDLVRTGSSLKFCRIAEGAADLYPRFAPTMEWDTAAAQAVLEAAGGAIRTTDGEALRYNKADLLNPHFVASGDPAWFG